MSAHFDERENPPSSWPVAQANPGFAGDTGEFPTLSADDVRGITYVGERPRDGTGGVGDGHAGPREPVVEREDLVHREPVFHHLLQDHARGGLADDVALAGEGETLYAPLLPGLQVDHHRAPALGASAGHRYVRTLQYPCVTRVLVVLHEHRYLLLAAQGRSYLSMGARTALPHSVHEPS